MNCNEKIEEFKANLPSVFKTNNQQLQVLIGKLNCSRPFEEQQKIIRKLANNLTGDEDVKIYTAKVLSYMFLTISATCSLKKTLWRLLINANVDVIQQGMLYGIKYIVEDTLLETDPIKLCVNRAKILGNFMSCFENIPVAIKALSHANDVIIPFAIEQYVQLITLNGNDTKGLTQETVNTYLMTSCKFLLCLIQQCNLDGKLKKLSVNLLKHSQTLVLNDNLPLEIRANCAHIMTTIMDYLPKQEKINFTFKVYPCLELVKTENVCQFDISENLTALICVYSAIVNNVPEEVLCETLYCDVPVIVYIFNQLMNLTSKFSESAGHIIIISRTFTNLTKMLNGMPLHVVEPIFSRGLEYVGIYLDHFVENVRQSTKIVFQNFTKLAVKHFKEGDTLLFKMIQLSIWDLLLNRHAHYTYLTILSAEIDADFLLETFENLPYLLLNHLDDDDTIAAEVCSTYERLMEQHAKKEDNHLDGWINTWLEPIIKLLENDDENSVSYCQRIIKSAFLFQPICIKKFIHFQYSNKPNELNALLECLRAARKKNLHISYKRPVSNFWRNYLEYNIIDTMICHQSDQVRMSLLGLVVETHKSTEIFTSYELNFLKKYFHYNVTTQEAYVRQEMLSLYKKALTRMRNGYMSIKKNGDSNTIEYESFYETFIKYYLKKGITNKNANVYRRSVSLELIVFMADIVPKNIWNNCWEEKDLRYLYDLFEDPYESTLTLALKLFKKLNSGGHQHKFHVNVEEALDNCLKSACSIQPSETTKSAYNMLICLQHPGTIQSILGRVDNDVKYNTIYELAIFYLLQHLDEQINTAEANLKEGIAIQPFYGLILTIRYIINNAENSNIGDWEIIIDTIFNLCERMSTIVGPIISNSSPEGFVPEEFQSTDQPLAQKILLFGWRSTKEMSLLIGEIMDKIPFSDPNRNKYICSGGFISKAETYFLKLFFETKHRGAFEQAYVGFCKLSKKLWEASQNHVQCFPEYWLNNVLKMLDDNSENVNVYSKLCATRRSAGLPFMIQAILVSQPKNNPTKIFPTCMEKLLSIAESNSNKSRTHALNILRALYRHNQLNEKVVPYISRGFIVSINGFDDSSWAIRNSSTLLFSALITRTFGVQRTKDVEDVSIKNKLSSRVFFTRYTGLYKFLLNKMEQFQEPANGNQLSIHPVLLILSRLYASNQDEEKHLVEYLPHVSHCLTLPPYRIRKLAAKASTCIIPKNYIVPYIIILLKRLSDMTITNNYCDAILLQLNFLLSSKVPEIKENFLPKLIEETFWIFMCAGKFTSHFTGSLYFDVIAAFVTKYNANCYGSEVFKNLGRLLLVQTICDEQRDRYKFLLPNHLMTSKRAFNRNRYFLHIYLVTTVYDCSDIIIKATYIKQYLFNGLNSDLNEIIEFTLDYLIYVGFQSPIHKLHALYLIDELEICKYAKRAVDSLSETLREELLNVLNVINPEFLQIISKLIHRNQNVRYQIFLLLYEYPCLLFKTHQNYISVMNFLFSYMFKDGDILYCAVLGCISRILESIVDLNGRRPFNMDPLVKMLEESALPNASLIKKLTLSQLLVANKNLLLYENNVLYDEERIQLWNVVISLLDDYDYIVRDTTSQLVTKDAATASTKCEIGLDLIPEKAKELLVHTIPCALNSSTAIRLLIAWSLNGRRKILNDNCSSICSNEIFATIQDNPYSEDEPLVQFALETLKKYLWTLDNGLSYDDYSIFLEEHLLLIATKVQNAIEHKELIPLTGNQKSYVLVQVIRKMIEFLELTDVGKPNFKNDLETELRSTLKLFTYNNETNEDTRERLKQLAEVIFGIA